MPRSLSIPKLALIAVCAPLVFSAGGTQIVYWMGSRAGDSFLSYLSMSAGILAGFACIGMMPLPGRFRAGIILVYAPTAFVISSILMLLVACRNGDCLW